MIDIKYNYTRELTGSVKYKDVYKMAIDEIGKLYDKEFPTTMTLEDVSEKLDTMEQHKHYSEFSRIFCNEIVSKFTE